MKNFPSSAVGTATRSPESQESSTPPARSFGGSIALLLAGALALALSTSGCASWPGIVDRKTPEGQDTSEKIEVQGLRQAIGDAAELGGSLQLFLVHGMSNHPFGPEGELGRRLGTPDYSQLLDEIKKPAWRAAKKEAVISAIQDYQFDPLVKRLAKELGVRDSRSDPSIEHATLEWLEDDGKLLGYQLRWPFEGSPDQNGRIPRLVVHLNSWAMVTIPHKVKLLGDDNHAGRKDFRLNRGLKDGLVSWGLMDAALYVGAGRTGMQQAVAQGLHLLAEGSLAPSRHDRFAFGAASLGSVITLDTMKNLLEHGGVCYGGMCRRLAPETIASMFRKGVPLFLFANQIPLLDPASVPASAAGSTAISESTAALTDLAERLPQGAVLTVVAFSDPSDMLSYRVPAIATARKSAVIRVVNIAVRNQSVGLWWLVSDPLAAHTGFPKTRAVMNEMVNGMTIEASATSPTGP
jgi:hypothetical protein